MKKVLLMLVVAMFSFSLYADEVQCLAIEYVDEATDYFALDANPVITYGDGTTINVTQDGEDAYSIEGISLDYVTKYYFTDAEPTTADEGGIPAGYILDPENESYPETLSIINVSYETDALTCADAVYAGATGTVTNKWGQEVATVSFVDSEYDENVNTYVICTVDPEVTTAGTYYVNFPAGVFMNWDDFGTNKAFSLTYYVTGKAGEYSYVPESGSTVYPLSSFQVVYSDGIACSDNYTGQITVTNEYGETVAYDKDCETEFPPDDPYGDGLYCTITLSDEIKTEGKYTINIPEGYFIVGESYLNSKALTIEYEVAVPEGIGGISAGGALMTGLEEGAHVYVYTADGQVVMSATAGKDGQVGVDLNSLKGGQVYILRTPKASYKIVK